MNLVNLLLQNGVIPVLVFDLGRPDNIVDAVLGENVGTVVTA